MGVVDGLNSKCVFSSLCRLHVQVLTNMLLWRLKRIPLSLSCLASGGCTVLKCGIIQIKAQQARYPVSFLPFPPRIHLKALVSLLLFFGLYFTFVYVFAVYLICLCLQVLVALYVLELELQMVVNALYGCWGPNLGALQD